MEETLSARFRAQERELYASDKNGRAQGNCFTLLLNSDRSTTIRNVIEPMPTPDALATVPDDWAIVLTALPTNPGEWIECHVNEQIVEDCPPAGTGTPDGDEPQGEVVEIQKQDVRILAQSADGNVLLAMAPQTCADVHIFRLREDVSEGEYEDELADSFYILYPGDAVEFSRHNDLFDDDCGYE